MSISIKTPDFLTELMKLWLFQFKQTQQHDITSIGLFHWNYISNKRNPTKQRKIPKIDQSEDLKKNLFNRAIYFLEKDEKTLHVLESSGLAFGGLTIAHEYTWDGSDFFKNPKKIFLTIR
jgi:hypothetical protein